MAVSVICASFMQAVEAAKTAAKSISDVQNAVEESESSNKNETEPSAVEVEGEDENDKRRKETLDKLEKASEDSFLGQASHREMGLKVIDNSVESIASGAWQALGNALKGGSSFVHKLEESIQQGGLPGATDSGAPSILETGKAFTAKGMQVLEQLGKETMDLLISETGIEVEKQTKETEGIVDEDQLFEEVTFDQCFYIYGGPEQLEELEALSNHYAMLFNRKKVKLPYEQRSTFDGKLKQRLSEVCCSAVTQILMLGKSIISDANKAQSLDEDVDEVDMVKINWPEDSIERAKIIRAKCISDVTEAYLDAIKAASHETPQKPIQDKVNAFSKDLSADQSTALLSASPSLSPDVSSRPTRSRASPGAHCSRAPGSGSSIALACFDTKLQPAAVGPPGPARAGTCAPGRVSCSSRNSPPRASLGLGLASSCCG
nr:uncharacterized protein LOC109161907 [Ipomoea batatas]